MYPGVGLSCYSRLGNVRVAVRDGCPPTVSLGENEEMVIINARAPSLTDQKQSVQHNPVTQPPLGSKAAPKCYRLIKHYITMSPNQTAEVNARGHEMTE